MLVRPFGGFRFPLELASYLVYLYFVSLMSPTASMVSPFTTWDFHTQCPRCQPCDETLPAAYAASGPPIVGPPPRIGCVSVKSSEESPRQRAARKSRRLLPSQSAVPGSRQQIEDPGTQIRTAVDAVEHVNQIPQPEPGTLAIAGTLSRVHSPGLLPLGPP